MKKILAILLAFIMVSCFAACGKKAEEAASQTAGLANPMIEYSSLEELNEANACNLHGPGAMGVTDESFAAIQSDDYTVAQYKFSIGGVEYNFRFCPVYDIDISGVYIDGKLLFAPLGDGMEGNIATEGYFGARWFNIDGQYCLTASSKDLDSETFASCAEELQSLTEPLSIAALPSYSEVAGEYQDSYSQRASAAVTENGDGVDISILWGNSAAETEAWAMTAKFSEDGLLSYSDCVHTVTGENEVSEIIASDLAGYFVFTEDGKLLWEGAPEEGCVQCTFEKVN